MAKKQTGGGWEDIVADVATRMSMDSERREANDFHVRDKVPLSPRVWKTSAGTTVALVNINK